MKIARRGIRLLRIDLVPLIDIVFQLILFFLVSAAFVPQPGIAVELPAAQTADSAAVPGLTLTADADGGVYLNGEALPLEALGERLAAYDTGSIERSAYPVRIEADRAAASGTVVSLFDALRANGFAAVYLLTTIEE